MRPVSPDIGWPEAVAGENELEHSPLPVAFVEHPEGMQSVVSRWRLTPEEREAVAVGADLFVTVLRPRSPLVQPLYVRVGSSGYELPEGFG